MTGFAHPEFLVETDWLEQHLDDPNVRRARLHDASDSRPEDHLSGRSRAGRISKRAISPARSSSMCSAISRTRRSRFRFMRRRPRISPPRWAASASATATRVVTLQHRQSLVGDAGLVAAARVRSRQRGGAERRLAEMEREGRPIETGPARARPPGNFTVREVRNADGRQGGGATAPSATARSARSTRCCRSSTPAAAATATAGPGRIKGSVNLPAAHLLDPETNEFLPPDELRKRFDGGRRLRQAGHHLLRRRHRGERRCAGAGHARPSPT